VSWAEEPRWLVDLAWLQTHLHDEDLILVDTRADKDYAAGHIPRALLLDLADLAPRTSEQELSAFQEELKKRFALLGYTGSEKVIFYDDGAATRAPHTLWNFMYAGGKNGRVLSGGFAAWKKAGFPLAWDRFSRPERPFPLNIDSSLLASSERVNQRLKDFSTIILDVRSQAEFAGSNPSTGGSRLGHIPGARWLEWTSLLGPDHQYLPPAEMKKKLSEAGVTPDKEVIVYCHRGNRASNTWLALRALGFFNVRNFIGSWAEWSARLDLPVAAEKKEAEPENPAP
jgi:thiosulfate/3-mercaptopyruvate sulfurtransferase